MTAPVKKIKNNISEIEEILKKMVANRKGCTSVLRPSLVTRVQLGSSLEIACK